MNDDGPEPVPAPKVPRGLACAVLAVLWLFPSIGAGFILLAVPETGWRLEQWLALSLLALHVVFIWGALAGSGFRMLRRGMAGRR